MPDLARAAVGAVGTRERFVVVDGLRHRGGAADQRELSAEARRVNVAGVLTPTPRLRSVTGGCLLVDDVGAVAAAVEAGGAPVRWNEEMAGVRRFHTDDPVGNRVEIQQA